MTVIHQYLFKTDPVRRMLVLIWLCLGALPGWATTRFKLMRSTSPLRPPQAGGAPHYCLKHN
jgi:hypothetical protein